MFGTGPYKINGVPLRRVNQSYVIATSTKVNIEGLELPAIDDAYFAKEKAAKKSKEEQFFAQSSAVSIFMFLIAGIRCEHPLPVSRYIEPAVDLSKEVYADGRIRSTNPFGISLVYVAVLLLA